MSCQLLKTMLIDTLGCTQLPHLNTSVRCAGMCSPYCECGLPQPAPARPSRKKSCATKRIARYLLLQDIKSYQITVQLQTDYRAKELAGDHSNKQVKAICQAICCQIPCLDTIYWARPRHETLSSRYTFQKKKCKPENSFDSMQRIFLKTAVQRS